MALPTGPAGVGLTHTPDPSAPEDAVAEDRATPEVEGRAPGRRGQRQPVQRAASRRGGSRRGGGNRGGGGGGRRSAGGSGQPGENNPLAELFKSLFGGRTPTKDELARLSAAERADFLREGLISPQELAEVSADGALPGAIPVADAGRDPANPAAWQQASFQADNLGLPTSSSLPWQTADAGGLGMFSPSSGGMPFGGISGPAFSGASVFGMG